MGHSAALNLLRMSCFVCLYAVSNSTGPGLASPALQPPLTSSCPRVSYVADVIALPSICLLHHRYEASALTLRSLRREVLCLLSSSSKVMADPTQLLSQALDPPDTQLVDDALDYLQQVGPGHALFDFGRGVGMHKVTKCWVNCWARLWTFLTYTWWMTH